MMVGQIFVRDNECSIARATCQWRTLCTEFCVYCTPMICIVEIFICITQTRCVYCEILMGESVTERRTQPFICHAECGYVLHFAPRVLESHSARCTLCNLNWTVPMTLCHHFQSTIQSKRKTELNKFDSIQIRYRSLATTIAILTGEAASLSLFLEKTRRQNHVRPEN